MAERKAHCKLNLPPDTSARVRHAELAAFVAEAVRRSGLDRERSDLLAGLLVGNDLRGVFSHGTRLAARYARAMRGGRLNARPAVRVVRETLASIVVDGELCPSKGAVPVQTCRQQYAIPLELQNC